jgi:hypothetical protein
MGYCSIYDSKCVHDYVLESITGNMFLTVGSAANHGRSLQCMSMDFTMTMRMTMVLTRCAYVPVHGCVMHIHPCTGTAAGER